MSELKPQICRPLSLASSALSTLVGREQEIQEGLLLLQRADVRMLTLTGVGGVGKTRLAQAIVESATTFFCDGALSISLASLSHPDLLTATFLQELGVREEPEQSPLTALLTFLRPKRLLLLLDNFEQIVAGAPLLVDLLERCPHLKMLVTSREILRVHGEYIFQVCPLPLPDLSCTGNMAELSQNTALQLFMQRVQSMQPTFPATEDNLRAMAAICVRLDGLPLAIELAAVRCKLFSPQALLQRLEHRLAILTQGMRDLPARQQTLRNTLAWSYDLLSHEEQRLFRSLAIFVGGCSIASAEFVCGGNGHFLNILTSLLEKSLLQCEIGSTGESRLRMLETIREYAQERLQISPEYREVQRLHASYHLLLAEQAELSILGSEGPAWIQRLDLEIDNIRQALRWWQACGENIESLRLLSALRYFWMLTGRGSEGYNSIIEVLPDLSITEVQIRAKALLTLGILAPYVSQSEEQAAYCQESLQLFQELGDQHGVAEALHALGCAASRRGQYTEARQLHTKSLACFQDIDDRWGIANSKLALAKVLHAQAENREARTLAMESLQLFRDMGNSRGLAQTLSVLAFIAGYYQEHSKAIALAEESLQIFKALGEQWEVATQLHYVAELARRQNDARRAQACAEESLQISRQVGHREAMARAHHLLALLQGKLRGDTASHSLLEHSLVLYEELNNQEGVALVLLSLAQTDLQHQRYQKARTLLERCFQILCTKENKPALIENLMIFARLAAAEGQRDWAIRLLGASDALREAIGRPPTSLEDAYRRVSALVAAPLDATHFAEIWAEGRAMTPQQAFASEMPTIASVSPYSQRQAPAPSPGRLTTREREVLDLLTMGLTNPQIAERLVISPVTVNAHVRSIYNKLDVTSRSAATRYALLHQLAH